jgi:hypothetical protein
MTIDDENVNTYLLNKKYGEIIDNVHFILLSTFYYKPFNLTKRKTICYNPNVIVIDPNVLAVHQNLHLSYLLPKAFETKTLLVHEIP